MVFVYPDDINKNVNIEALDEQWLSYWHNQLHILWSKVESGVQVPDWTFLDLYTYHQRVISSMSKKGINHLMPINRLDELIDVPAKGEEKKMTSELSEKQTSTFHVSIHKSNEEVKIFSEDDKDITSSFPTLTNSFKKLSTSNFIIEGELVSDTDLGSKPIESNVKFHVCDLIYLDKPLTDLTLQERVKLLGNLNLNEIIDSLVVPKTVLIAQ